MLVKRLHCSMSNLRPAVIVQNMGEVMWFLETPTAQSIGVYNWGLYTIVVTPCIKDYMRLWREP